MFLAVFLGFIAENIRENLSERSKEHDYIEGLVKNLESDTSSLRIITTANRKQISGLDSLRKISKDKLSQLPVQDSLFLLSRRYLYYMYQFQSNDATVSELRNSGNYQIIKKDGVLDSLADFESSIESVRSQYAATYTIFEKARDRSIEILDMSVAQQFKKSPTGTPVLITTDKAKTAAYLNSCWMAQVALTGYNNMLEGGLPAITKLIAYLKKEYDIK